MGDGGFGLEYFPGRVYGCGEEPLPLAVLKLILRSEKNDLQLEKNLKKAHNPRVTGNISRYGKGSNTESQFSLMARKAQPKENQQNLHNLSAACLPGSLPFTSITQINEKRNASTQV